MIPFLTQAQQYVSYHNKPETQYTHYVGIPLIILSLMIAFGLIRIVMPNVFNISLATIVTVLVMIYYFRLEWRLAVGLLPAMIILLLIALFITRNGPTPFAVWFFIVTFVLGWALQLIGHMIEGRRPAFVDNLWQAIIAPLVITAEILFKMGYLHGLRDQIHGSAPAVVITDSKPL